MDLLELHFDVEISLGGSQECNVTPESDWIVIEKWLSTSRIPHHVIRIRRKSQPAYVEFYADAVIILDYQGLILTKISKGSWRNIEIIITFRELVEAVTNNIRGVEQLLGRRLTYRVQISPVLRMAQSIAHNIKGINEENVKILCENLGKLREAEGGKNYFDIVVTCGDNCIKAHKCILAARLPNFTRRITGPLPIRLDYELEEVKLDLSAEAGFEKMMEFVYTNNHPENDMLSLGNLAVTAEAMNSKHLKIAFLEKFMLKMTVKTVLYVIFFTDLHGESLRRKIALRYMLEHFEAVQTTPEWNNLEVIFTCMLLRDEELGDVKLEDVLKLSLRSHVKMFYLL